MARRRLFVGGLPFEMSTDDLFDVFSAFGDLVDCTIATHPDGHAHEGESRGFGFVEFATVDDANAAREALDGDEIAEGRRLCVHDAHPKGREGRRRTQRDRSRGVLA